MLPELPAMLCCFTDYFGLSSFTLSLVYSMSTQFSDAMEADTYSAVIVSVQFAGVIFGHLIWGMVSDRYSPRYALQLIMLGDFICFTLSGFLANPVMLALTRFFAGMFTPMTAAFAFVFDQYTPDKIMPAFAHITLAGTSGSIAGPGGFGLLYSPFSNVTLFETQNGDVSLGWLIINAFTGLLALFSFYLVYVSGQAPNTGDSSAKKTPKKVTGIWKAVKSPLQVSMFFTAYLCGWLIANLSVIPGLMYNSIFRLTATEVTIVYLGISLLQICVAMFVLPKTTVKIGKTATSSIGGFGSAFFCVIIAMAPFIESRALSLGCVLVAHLFLKACMVTFQIPNQAKVQVIAAVYTQNGRGMITALSRVVFALGQASGPAISVAVGSAFPQLGYSASWIFLSVLILVHYFIYFMLGVPVFREHRVTVKWEAANLLAKSNKPVLASEPTEPTASNSNQT